MRVSIATDEKPRLILEPENDRDQGMCARIEKTYDTVGAGLTLEGEYLHVSVPLFPRERAERSD